MKNAILYVLLFATLLPTVSQWGTVAYYHVNKDYIARVLCENRNKPQLHCDGKCFLAKRLKAQQDKQDKQTTQRVQNMPVMQLFCESGFYFDFLQPEALLQYVQTAYTAAAYESPTGTLLRPPCLPASSDFI